MLLLFSCSKGVAANLLKVGVKRRRSKEEVAQEKLELQSRDAALRGKDNRLLQMAQQLSEMQEEVHVNASAVKCLNQMVEAGIVVKDADGNISAALNPRLIRADADDDF